MNTNHEMDQIVRDWLEDRVVEPPRSGLQEALSNVSTTPQTRRRSLGRWLERVGGARRRTDEHDHPPDQAPRRHRLMFSASGLVAALVVLALAVSVVSPTDQTQPPAADSGAIHVVAADGSGQFSTIGEAVAAAEDGDTILVRPGTYTEAIVIDKDITLRGDGPVEEIVLTVGKGLILNLTGSDAVIEGLSFSGPDSSGVLAQQGAPTFVGNRFVNVGVPFRAGLYCSPSCDSLVIEGGATATVLGNEFVDGGELVVESGSAALIEGNHLAGGPNIALVDVADGTIVHDNVVEGALVRGISVFQGGSPTISDNVIRESGSSGIDIWAGSPLVEGNEITGPGTFDGINVWEGARGTSLVRNRLINNRNAVTWNAPDGTIEANSIGGGTGGLSILAGSPAVVENTIQGVDGHGLLIGIGSAPTLTRNVSCDNRSNLLIGDEATPVIDDTNEICEDAPVSAAE